jgi:hypothetical protein
MALNGKIIERIAWSPVHGATLRVDGCGLLVAGDSPRLDYHLLRWSDRKANGARVKLTIVARPVDNCDTNLYVHHWGPRDICSISKEGSVILRDGAEELHVKSHDDGFLEICVIFTNCHDTLSVGMGKPGGYYLGTGTDQYLFKSIDIELLPLNPIRQMLVDRLWRGNDPVRGISSNLFEYDLQGWNSQHAYLDSTIAELCPEVIVEVGVWKGGSTVFMADAAKKLGLRAVVIAVDTWLGSSEHWLHQNLFSQMSFFGGYPALYHKFVSNVIHAEVEDYVIPIPLDSLNAADIMRSLGVTPGIIHLDGGHDYNSVKADLTAWWPLLAPGGVLIGDDYFETGMWESVRQAFDDFFGPLDLMPIENIAGKCRIRKDQAPV